MRTTRAMPTNVAMRFLPDRTPAWRHPSFPIDVDGASEVA